MRRSLTSGGGGTSRAVDAERARTRVLELVRRGYSIAEALRQAETSRDAYLKWRQRHPAFRIALDEARVKGATEVIDYAGDYPSFVAEYFGMEMADFQLDYTERMDRLRPGDILMALWPPEHGKTTTFENKACHTLAFNPQFRYTVGSESSSIARKITGRVMNRMEPEGSARQFVRDFGPFVPQVGVGRKPSQPWNATMFNVYKKATHDERDYTMMAIGRDSSIVSTRADHLHIDDVQSTKTKNLTPKILEWFRQDALSRPGEHGVTTIAGTRVCPEDFYESLEEDPDLVGILHVKKYPAIITDQLTGEQRPLLPQRYTLDNLDRMRRKVGQEAWDRNYMQNPGASGSDRVIDDDAIERSKDPELSLLHAVPEGTQIVVALDPALGGLNCVMATEFSRQGKLIVRWIAERANLRTNEQIMDELGRVVMRFRAMDARVTDVVIETMNFQRGLARDERLTELREMHGFAIREHLTGWNKYDEQIGIASMAMSLRKGDVVLPYAEDRTTRHEIDELIRQMKSWRHGHRGSRKRQDRLMALWFAWILWQSRFKRATEQSDDGGWRRDALPWKRMEVGLIVPARMKVSA